MFLKSISLDAVSAASITEMAFMSAVTMNGSDDGNVSALNDADGTSDAVNNTDNVVQQAWAESATYVYNIEISSPLS